MDTSARGGLSLACLVLIGLAAGAGCGGEDSGGDSVKVYFTAGEQLLAVERDIPDSGSTVSGALNALLEGPPAEPTSGGVEAVSQIPPGVELEQASLDGEGIAEVQVSPDFLDGIPEDPARRSPEQKRDLNARLAQLTYTVTQFGDVKGAKVLAGGRVLNPDLSREELGKPAGGPPRISKPRGARLPGTRKVQTKLAKLGYLPKSAVDGRDGYWTRQAVTAFQAWNGLDRDGVAGAATAAAFRTAKRPAAQPGGPAKRLEVYNEKGVTLEIDGGRVVRAIHTSSGAPGTETPTGGYSIGRKEINSWSVPFSSWLPYASYFNQGIAFHEYPDVPAHPASHGCVRVPAPEAKALYAFAALGTPVFVY